LLLFFLENLESESVKLGLKFDWDLYNIYLEFGLLILSSL
jgi:hypothetical protein